MGSGRTREMEAGSNMVKKVAPYYKKTSEVIAGTQIGSVLCCSLFAVSLYRIMTEIIILARLSRMMISDALLYGTVAFFSLTLLFPPLLKVYRFYR